MYCSRNPIAFLVRNRNRQKRFIKIELINITLYELSDNFTDKCTPEDFTPYYILKHQSRAQNFNINIVIDRMKFLRTLVLVFLVISIL